MFLFKEQRMYYATSLLSMISSLPKEVLQKQLKSVSEKSRVIKLENFKCIFISLSLSLYPFQDASNSTLLVERLETTRREHLPLVVAFVRSGSARVVIGRRRRGVLFGLLERDLVENVRHVSVRGQHGDSFVGSDVPQQFGRQVGARSAHKIPEMGVSRVGEIVGRSQTCVSSDGCAGAQSMVFVEHQNERTLTRTQVLE